MRNPYSLSASSPFLCPDTTPPGIPMAPCVGIPGIHTDDLAEVWVQLDFASSLMPGHGLSPGTPSPRGGGGGVFRYPSPPRPIPPQGGGVERDMNQHPRVFRNELNFCTHWAWGTEWLCPSTPTTFPTSQSQVKRGRGCAHTEIFEINLMLEWTFYPMSEYNFSPLFFLVLFAK